ncbi:MAG: hypothetical protein QY332_06035 [Anaerolineales bacterium]|nr:MAG: hypothetical protein QY332_06035 [Anaerolineales bacterium]
MNIPNVHHYIHAYKVAPWRVQRQWIGNALLLVVASAMVAALYLNITSRTSIAGREIQELNYSITFSQQVSSDLQTQLASLTSVSVMQRRAHALGFRPMQHEEVEYLIVPGYSAPEPINLASVITPQWSAPVLPREYTQSLLDWMDEKILSSRGMQ